MTPPIRLVLIDDHALFQEGLKFLLEQHPNYQVVATANNGQKGLHMVEQYQPDLVILDLDMPVMNGVQTLKALRQRHLDLPILMLTISEHSQLLKQCMALGANGYLTKNIDSQLLIASIQDALQGQLVVCKDLPFCSDGRIDDLPSNQHQLLQTLSNRETQVLQLIAEGCSNKVIASELNVAENTIKVHVQNILRKLNINSRTQAAVFANQHLQSPNSAFARTNIYNDC